MLIILTHYLFNIRAPRKLSGGFAPCFGKKCAGVDNVDIGIFRIEANAVTGGEERSGDEFGFNEIFRTSQGGDEKIA